MNQQPKEQNEKTKVKWERPRCRRFDARNAELGLGIGEDLIILTTSS
ncbi:MAG: hypothetical protein WDM91_01620 [Rhizomicrobium sp.]